MTTNTKRPIELGEIRMTDSARDAFPSHIERIALLTRHSMGDWGCVQADIAAANDAAIDGGGRLLSAYPIDPAQPCRCYGPNCIWIFTEADRSATTFLLLHEY